MIGHGGDTHAFHADFNYIPELKVGAVVLTNSVNGSSINSASESSILIENITATGNYVVTVTDGSGNCSENITITTNTPSKPSKEQIINQAIQFHLKGNIPEATKYYQFCIKQDFNNHLVFSNYGTILQGLGKLEEAANWYRKAIELNPNFANAYANLGNILREVAKLKEAARSYRKAIEIKPDNAEAH